MKSSSVSCEQLAEYLDGSFDESERATIEQALHQDPDARKRLEQLRLLSSALSRPVESLEHVDMQPRVQAAMAARIEAKRAGRDPRRYVRLLSMAAAACVMLGVGLHWLPRSDSEFRARGRRAVPAAASNWAGVQIYRALSDTDVKRVGDSIAQGDRLLFAYTNLGPKPFRYLMVFAVDSQANVYWFHPSYEDAQSNPSSTCIEAHGTQTLAELIEHHYSPGPLTLRAIFTHAPMHVQDVETWLHAGSAALESHLPDDAHLQTTLLQVTP